MKMNLGRQETQLIAYLQIRQQQTVRTGELLEPLRLTEVQERKLLSRMTKAGLIARVWRGLYLAPSQLPLGGSWSPDEALALNTLMENRKGKYQVCGPNAFNRYGFDNQIPNRIYTYNNRLSGERAIGKVSLTLIKVTDNRLGATELIETAQGRKMPYSSRVRTLVDAVYDWSRFNGLPRGFGWIREELASGRVSANELVETTLLYGNTGTIRRIGALLEVIGVEDFLLQKLEQALQSSSSLIPWIPALPKRGSVNGRWGVVFNEQA